MTTSRTFVSLALFLTGLALFAGCMTPVTVVTDPPGATVYCRGAGRNAYRWRPRGTTSTNQPVVFKVPYNAIQTKVVWPGEKGEPSVPSETTYTKLLFKEDPLLRFERK